MAHTHVRINLYDMETTVREGHPAQRRERMDTLPTRSTVALDRRAATPTADGQDAHIPALR